MRHRFAPVGLVLVCAALLGAQEVGASAPWAIQPTPNPPGSLSSDLAGVSCPVVASCTAVGDYLVPGAESDTLAERWKGGVWVVQPTPNPAGADLSWLSGVSCVSADAYCVAVGAAAPLFSEDLMLAERWNGSWTIQPTATPAGSITSQLQGVSCTATSACTAVGGYGDPGGPWPTLAERWNGTGWAIQPTPNPVAARSSLLYGVSCPTSAACTAVGEYLDTAGDELMLAERWNGIGWVVQPTPNPRGATSSVLSAVSCPSATACTAVGYYETSAGVQVRLVEAWNGAVWAIQPTPIAAGAGGNLLTGVSCPATTACTAVGTHANSSGVLGTPLVEIWNGTVWAMQPSPNPAGSLQTFLNAASCPAVSACTTVGQYFPSAAVPATLAEHY